MFLIYCNSTNRWYAVNGDTSVQGADCFATVEEANLKADMLSGLHQKGYTVFQACTTYVKGKQFDVTTGEPV